MKQQSTSEEHTKAHSQSQFSEYSTFGTGPDFWACAAGITEAEVINPKAPSSSRSRSLNSESSCATSSNTSASPQMSEDKKGKRSLDKMSPESNGLEKNRKKARIDAAPLSKRLSNTSEEEFINLSPPRLLQNFIKTRQLPYSVLWELTRLVSKGQRSWSKENQDGPVPITVPDLDKLQSNTNSDGIKKLQKVIHLDRTNDKFAQLYEYERKATDPWPLLDKEESQSDNLGQLDPERGRVHFIATLTFDKCSKTLKFELNAAKLGASHSFSRHFGSKSFLYLTLSDGIINQADRLNVLNYLRKPVILCQNVFRAFYLKDNHVYYFKTNELWDIDEKKISSAVSPGLSFLEFIEWHNPIGLNRHQTMAKWAARFALGLSPSILGFTLEENNINIIEDRCSSTTNSDMTDGAGYITRHLLQKLSVQHDWPTRPSAIQVRVRGSKGLLVEDPDIKDESFSIKLRPSLMKIKYESPLDATHRTIDILHIAHARTPARISTDIIINLYENGVKFTSLCQLMKQSIDGIVDPLLDWHLDEEDPNTSDNSRASLALWVSYERAGSVIRSRRAREEVALARINGFSGGVLTNESAQELDELEDVLEHSAEWFPDRVSGCPSSLEETIIEFLDSGFHPRTCPMLREKMNQVLQSIVSRAVENYTIELPFSASAWIIPDPSERLESNEVFFQCSRSLPALDGTETNIITGDVLVTRDPCRLPTDVQKWKAVDVPELHQYKDVIILSVKGSRRAADWLAGGDYDGDRVKLIWQPELVTEFRNAKESFADPPSDLDSKFEVENVRVEEFLSELKDCSDDVKINKIQKYLLGTLKDFSLVGRYSNFHEISVYMDGYQSEKTKLLAYMFTTILDGRKTGKTVRKEVLRADSAKFELRHLPWKDKHLSAEQLAARGNTLKVRRNRNFIMEKLSDYGQQLKKETLTRIRAQIDRCPTDRDPALTAPYDEVVQRINRLRSEQKESEILVELLEKDLSLIKQHVKEAFDQYKADSTKGPPGNFSNLPIGHRQDTLRKRSRVFNSKPDQSMFVLMSAKDVEQVKASYAYTYDWEQSRPPSRFPWNVAFRELCMLKCGKDMKPVDRRFYDHMTVKPSRPTVRS